jgi:hypothetical protein
MYGGRAANNHGHDRNKNGQRDEKFHRTGDEGDNAPERKTPHVAGVGAHQPDFSRSAQKEPSMSVAPDPEER